MKTLLYLNNYANSFEDIEKANKMEYPRQHLWGSDYLSKYFNIILPIKKFHNSSKNRIKRILYVIKYQIYLYTNYSNVDVVYAACNHIIEIFAFLKMIKIYHGKIIYINHHNNKIFFINGTDKIITISNDIQDILRKRYSKYKGKIVNINWGGETEFYKKYKMGSVKKYTFIQNGKSQRDNNILIKALCKMNESAIILSNEIYLPELINNKSIIIKNKIVSPIENIELLSCCKIMVIPIIQTNKSLCGLTSFVDAMHMGLPVIVSSNAFLGVDVEKEKIGFFYKAGDLSSLMKKMNILISEKDLYAEYSKNCSFFSQNNTYGIFCDKLLNLITQ